MPRWLLPVAAGAVCLGAALPVDAQTASISVGLYTAADGGAQRLTIAPNEPFWLYLLLDRPACVLGLVNPSSEPGEWICNGSLHLQCRFDVPPNLWIINVDESMGGVCDWFNQETDPEVDAYLRWSPGYWPDEFPACLPQRCILRIGLMALDTKPASIYMRPGQSGGTAEGLPILDYGVGWFGQGRSGQVGLSPLPGGVNAPIFTINDGQVSTDEMTWSGLKALYR